eukprot:1146696-Pelagomonas_calceolata.AAC.1
MSLLHHKATDLEVLMGIWRVTGSTRLQDLAVRSIFVLNSTPCGTCYDEYTSHKSGPDQTKS